MAYIHVTICLRDGTNFTGVRLIREPAVLEDVRREAQRLSADVLGQENIEDVLVKELPASDPAVLALIVS